MYLVFGFVGTGLVSSGGAISRQYFFSLFLNFFFDLKKRAFHGVPSPGCLL